MSITTNRETCLVTGKICFSLREAHIFIKDAKRHNRYNQKKIPKRSYYCKECGAYHLTSLKYSRPEKRRLKWKKRTAL